jgi:hypothetical protein
MFEREAADDLRDGFPIGIEEVVDGGALFDGVNANPNQREQVRGRTGLRSATSAEIEMRLRFGLIKSDLACGRSGSRAGPLEIGV